MKVSGGGDEENSSVEGVKLHSLGMTVLSSATVDVTSDVDWFAVLCAEMIHDVINTHDPDSPQQGCDDDNAVAIA